jgi:hypothetical protein
MLVIVALEIQGLDKVLQGFAFHNLGVCEICYVAFMMAELHQHMIHRVEFGARKSAFLVAMVAASRSIIGTGGQFAVRARN